MELLAHVWPYFSLLEESILSSIEAAPPHVPTAVQEAPFSPHPRRHLLLHIIRITAILTGGGASSWQFDLHFPGDWQWGASCGPSVRLLWSRVCSAGSLLISAVLSAPDHPWCAPLSSASVNTMSVFKCAPSCKNSSHIGLGPPFDLTLTGYICNNLRS